MAVKGARDAEESRVGWDVARHVIHQYETDPSMSVVLAVYDYMNEQEPDHLGEILRAVTALLARKAEDDRLHEKWANG